MRISFSFSETIVYKLRGVTHERFQCLKCMKKLDDRLKMKSHVSACAHARDFIRWPCFTCGKSYKTKGSLIGHNCKGGSVQGGESDTTEKGLAAHKCNVESKWPCVQCGQSYTTQKGLAAHKCDEKNKWPCFHCGNSYTTYMGLAAHKCDKKIKLPCFTCGKSYSTKRGLIAHKCTGKIE